MEERTWLGTSWKTHVLQNVYILLSEEEHNFSWIWLAICSGSQNNKNEGNINFSLLSTPIGQWLPTSVYQKDKGKNPFLKWHSQAPPRDMLSHMVWVKSNLVCNRYSSWFNGSGPRKIFWEPQPKPCCLLHLLLSVQSRQSLWEDPRGGSRHWDRRGRRVLNSHPLPRDAHGHSPVQLQFPQLSLEPSREGISGTEVPVHTEDSYWNWEYSF